jgi:hypothetical protein
MMLDENKAKFRLVCEEILNKGNIDLFDEARALLYI